MAREYLRVTKESVAGTFDTLATLIYIIDIDSANGYTVRPAPVRVTLRTAGSSNRRAATIAKKKELKGNLAFTVRGSQAALLADWCVGTSGGTVQATYTVDHCIVLEDTGATKVLSRDLGMYVGQAQINASEQDQWLKAQLQLVGLSRVSITATDFPEPALSAYPADAFLTFEDATAGLTLHGETRTDIEMFNLTIKNLLDVRYFISAYPQKIRPCGRDVDATTRLSYKTSVPRADWEAMTPIATAITFNNGVNSLAINMESANYYSALTDQLDNSKVYLQEVTLESHLDYTAGNDFVMTAT